MAINLSEFSAKPLFRTDLQGDSIYINSWSFQYVRFRGNGGIFVFLA